MKINSVPGLSPLSSCRAWSLSCSQQNDLSHKGILVVRANSSRFSEKRVKLVMMKSTTSLELLRSFTESIRVDDASGPVKREGWKGHELLYPE